MKSIAAKSRDFGTPQKIVAAASIPPVKSLPNLLPKSK
jgi:hypothetical protein